LAKPLPYHILGGPFSMRLRIIVGPSGQRRAIERVALGLLGLAILLSVGGMVVKAIKPKSPPHAISVSGSPSVGEARRADAQPAGQTAGDSKADVRPPLAAPRNANPEPQKGAAAETLSTPSPQHTAKARPADGESNNGFQLRSGGSLAVLAYDEAAAAELREKPDVFSDLVQKGLLFTVPNHSAVAIEESHDGLLKIRILDGAAEGKVGWVRANQVTAR
jgi:hypothetical protein